MKTVSTPVKDTLIKDVLSIAKITLLPLALLSTCLVLLSVSSLFAYAVLGQSQTGIQTFFSLMNITSFALGLDETLRLLIINFNWLTLLALVGFTVKSFLEYIRSAQQAAMESPAVVESNIEYFPQGKRDNDQIKQVENF